MIQDLAQQAESLSATSKAVLLEQLERTEAGNPPAVVAPEILATICGAQLPFAGRYDDYKCHRTPMENGRCRLHGGGTPSGVNSKTFKHGRYSKYIPKNLGEVYETARADVDLAALGEEVALLTARISALLEKLESAEAPPWDQVLIKWGEFVARLPAGHEKELEELRDLICRGGAAAIAERQMWEEIRELIQEKTKTAGAEWSRLKDLQCLVHIDKVLALNRGIIEALRFNITDPVQLKAVLGDIMRFMPSLTSDSGAV